jgi:hypothetical protein
MQSSYNLICSGPQIFAVKINSSSISENASEGLSISPFRFDLVAVRLVLGLKDEVLVSRS